MPTFFKIVLFLIVFEITTTGFASMGFVVVEKLEPDIVIVFGMVFAALAVALMWFGFERFSKAASAIALITILVLADLVHIVLAIFCALLMIFFFGSALIFESYKKILYIPAVAYEVSMVVLLYITIY